VNELSNLSTPDPGWITAGRGIKLIDRTDESPAYKNFGNRIRANSSLIGELSDRKNENENMLNGAISSFCLPTLSKSNHK
jgi:hypothetical protein